MAVTSDRPWPGEKPKRRRALELGVLCLTDDVLVAVLHGRVVADVGTDDDDGGIVPSRESR